jgi:hypothetical protein
MDEFNKLAEGLGELIKSGGSSDRGFDTKKGRFFLAEYSRILLTKQRIIAINTCMNVNISFKVLVNIHICEYIFVVFSTYQQVETDCDDSWCLSPLAFHGCCCHWGQHASP